MDPYAAGMGESDIVFCQLSPLHPITLDAETKVAANIPAAAIHFAWHIQWSWKLAQLSR